MKSIVTHTKAFLLAALLVLVFSPAITLAQLFSNNKGWHLDDLQTDGHYGISLNKAYMLLQGMKGTPVIVAVIDSGIDTAHEDLKNILWTNTGEIPGNGIDDDHNGYVDDVHGWNFLGNKSGINLKKDIDERSRTYYRYKDMFLGKAINVDSLDENTRWLYYEWKKAAGQMNITDDERMEIALLDITRKAFKKHEQEIKLEMNKDVFTSEEVEKFQPQSSKGKQAKMGYITCLKIFGADQGDATNTAIMSDLDDYIDGKKQTIDEKTSQPRDYRKEIINDNYLDFNDRYYGNSDIMGPSPLHGTHVSGIIAAQRDNGTGIDGVAANVRIMMIRAIPEGDEYDKDIALAIRYAVDNGAKVINMSFGKSFSPEKHWVDEAVEYAAGKDVLLVHASGNESHNVDSVDNFPNGDLMEFHHRAPNFISVDASGDPNIGDGRIVADFSNYGKSTDVFAPGVKIYSTLPGGNRYGFEQGTSMSAPVVSGVAALIRSYFPQLSAVQVKNIILRSAQHLPVPGPPVLVPGTSTPATLSDLCISAGIVNAAAAIQLAENTKPEPILMQAMPVKKIKKG
ncbi:MAG TPA: S8 family serine peptidase [Chitinophagaceae bacterium]|nr:S8 family serine peptidase [Chitinophagaceae bacterium]